MKRDTGGFSSRCTFQDIYGNLSDTSYKGVINPFLMESQVLVRVLWNPVHILHTFNENYQPLAALDVLPGICYVALQS